MDVTSMRCIIADAYPGERWKFRCEIMPENQVIAIYNHFLRDGVFEKRRVARKKLSEQSKMAQDYRQLDLFRDFGIARR